MSESRTIGFIGLGVMGEPICRNLVKKSGKRVLAFDLAAEPLARLRAEGAEVAESVADVIKQSDLLFLCLPSAKHVRAVFEGDGILNNIRERQVVVDLGTSSVSQTRDFAKQLQARGAAWADAPIARTRQAAQDRTRPALWRDRALDPLLCYRCHPLRRGRRGTGDEDPQQHGAVRDGERAGRSGRGGQA